MNQERKLYRFSPIKDRPTLIQSVEYVATEVTKMLFRNQGYTVPIKYVTIFSHYDDEYASLIEIASELGSQSETNNGVKTILAEPIKVTAMKLDANGKQEDVVHTIGAIRIRKPDPYRMQVGCCDLEYSGDYEWLAGTETLSRSNIRRIQRSDIDMVEFYDPNFDTLAYVVK